MRRRRSAELPDALEMEDAVPEPRRVRVPHLHPFLRFRVRIRVRRIVRGVGRFVRGVMRGIGKLLRRVFKW